MENRNIKVLTHAFHTVIEYYWYISLPEVSFYRGDIRPIDRWWGYELRPQPKNCILQSSNNYDLAIAHTIEGYIWLKERLNKIKCKCPIIYWFHQFPSPSEIDKLNKIIGKKEIDSIDTVYYSKEEMEAWGFGKNKYVIKHGIDYNIFDGWVGNKKKAIAINSSKITNWGDMKGVSFLQQMKDLEFSPVYYSIYGGDVYLTTEQDVLDQLQEHRIYINVAWKLDRSPLEAMSCGMPVIARRTPQFTLKEYFKDGENIILVDTPKDMIDSIKYMLNNYERCRIIGNNARQTIIQNFSKEQNSKDWMKVFKDIIK